MNGSPLSQVGHVFSLFMNGRDTLPLRAGEIVTAEVIDVRTDSSAAIRLKNTTLEVQTEIPLQKGDSLNLRVERQENSVYLRLSGHGAEEADSIKNTILSALNKLEGLNSGTAGMEKLVRLLAALPGPLKQSLPETDIINRFLLQIEDLSGKSLQDVVENGGIFFEAKLRILAGGMEAEGLSADIEAGRIIAGDLKASLLRLKDMFLAPAVMEHVRGRLNTDELLGALNTVIRNIEFYQLQSKLTDSLQFFLPLVWRELREGEVILREYDRGKVGERSFTCTVNLDLERAGKVRVNLVSQGGYMHVTCTAEKSDFTRLLKEGAGVLREQFVSAGLRLGHVVVHHHPTINFENSAAAGVNIEV
jgi:Flagellar hook-length control protein FliK